MASLKNILLLAGLACCYCHHGIGQGKPPVLWHFKSDRIKNSEVLLILTATLAPGWHVYSRHMNDGGPMPTRVTIERSDNYTAIGPSEEKGNAVRFHDDLYEMEITWYADEVTFLERVKLIQQQPVIKGTIEYMACNEHMCIPGKEEFQINIHPEGETP